MPEAKTARAVLPVRAVISLLEVWRPAMAVPRSSPGRIIWARGRLHLRDIEGALYFPNILIQPLKLLLDRGKLFADFCNN
jgi:hypothetical protein